MAGLSSKRFSFTLFLSLFLFWILWASWSARPTIRWSHESTLTHDEVSEALTEEYEKIHGHLQQQLSAGAALTSKPTPAASKALEGGIPDREEVLPESSIAYATPTPSPPKSTSTTVSNPSSPKSECQTLPGAEDVFVILKTGATEIYEKLPQQILTLLSCTPNYLILSDLEQNLGGHHVQDILQDISEDIRSNHEDFKPYREYQQLVADGQDPSILKGTEAWTLDKWKFIPMLRKAWQVKPKAKWYLFIEADTAVLWPNLLQWLSKLNHQDLIYAGSQNSVGGTSFAHGGSGVLVSNAALKKFEEAYASHRDAWKTMPQDECCGDVILAKAMADAGIAVTAAFPLIQGEMPVTVDWNKRKMCTPTVTWHHVNSKDVDMLWNYQKNWTDTNGYDEPYLFRDLFRDFVRPHLREARTEWDNISEDWKYTKPSNLADEAWTKLTEFEKESVESFDGCHTACEMKEECMQFKYRPGECVLGRDIRLGRVTTGTASGYDSGWLLDRIDSFEKTFDGCKPNWSFNQ